MRRALGAATVLLCGAAVGLFAAAIWSHGWTSQALAGTGFLALCVATGLAVVWVVTE